MEMQIPQIMPHEKLFVALENFSGQQQGDLSFNKGKFILFMKKF